MTKTLKDSLQYVRYAIYNQRSIVEAFKFLMRNNLRELYDENGDVWKKIIGKINDSIEFHNKRSSIQIHLIDADLTFAYLVFLYDGNEDDFEKGVNYYFSLFEHNKSGI